MQTTPLRSTFDSKAFAADLDALRKRVRAELCEEDLHHRQKIERWGRICTALGYGTAWLGPNPLSAALISQGRVTRWAMLAHHTLHRGYDHVPGAKPAQTSRGFAKGWRRFIDWFDWIEPEAWSHEHNQLHHYRLGEAADPDLLEDNVDWLRDSKIPRAAKLAVVGFFMGTWKYSYYAPSTLKALANVEGSLAKMYGRPRLWTRGLVPYALWHFVLAPLAFLPLGPWAAGSVAMNSLLAELFTNLHTFLIIVTNHAGEDLHRFDERMTDKAEFYRRQVVGSTNFKTGGDFNDFLHGWLNYQIEHHVFPDLPMRQYARLQPELKAICEKHGVPYVQESVWTRLQKTLAIATGSASMRRS
ncbi:MAG: fatty acid desaturase [Myxococcota bacterium]